MWELGGSNTPLLPTKQVTLFSRLYSKIGEREGSEVRGKGNSLFPLLLAPPHPHACQTRPLGQGVVMH